MSIANIDLQLLDVFRQPLTDPNLIIDCFSSDNSKHFNVSLSLSGEAKVSVTLQDPGDGLYRVMLMPTNYRTIQFFLRIAEGQTATRDPVIFPVNPEKVIGIDAPTFHALPEPLQTVLTKASLDSFMDDRGAHLQGADLYDALPSLLKAALLNLFSKSSGIQLPDGNSVFSYLGVLNKLKQDRLFATTTSGMFEETMQDSFFHFADDSLHETVAPYHIVKSYKTRDAHGNLQLTFSRNGETGNDYLVDMDIDEAQGIEHIFEVAHNLITLRHTNPYDVREILVADQSIVPLYSFRFAASQSAAVAVGSLNQVVQV